jgi:hypothetical protein
MPWATNEPAIEELTREALGLLSFDLEDLYAVLGCQLLATAPPTRAARVMTSLANLGTTPQPKKWEGMNPGTVVCEWSQGIDNIARELRLDGSRFIDEMREDFRRSLCTKEILDLTEGINASRMQILILLISAIVKMPPQFESISATLAAMFCKSLLREMCQ